MTRTEHEPLKYHGNISAFKDMRKGIDFAGAMRTLTWDPEVNIQEVLERVIIDEQEPEGVDIRVTVGDTQLKVNAASLVAFERNHHYLSQPSRIRESARSALGIRAVVKQLAGVESFTDYCGRMGVSSAIVKDLLNPKKHTINEEEAVWLPHLQLNFPKAKMFNLPVIDAMANLPGADLALVDYCSWIPSRDMEGTAPVFSKGHEYIIMTDATPFFWHLNRDSYVKGILPSAPVDHSKYIADFSDWLAGTYGYNISYSIRRNTIVTHLLQKGKTLYRGTQVKYTDVYKPTDAGFKIHVGKSE